MGSIRRSPYSPDKWQVRYIDPGGVSRTRTLPSKADSKAFLATVEADISRGVWRDPSTGKITFAAWVAEYLDGASHKRATTLARDRHVLRAHFLPDLGSHPMASITPLDVRRGVMR